MTEPATVERRVERHRSAALRAVSGRPQAELRGGMLSLDGLPVGLATPYLLGVDDTASAGRWRGVGDAMAALLRSSDLALHEELRPDQPLQRIVFDVLEQLRCEALIPDSLGGVRQNIALAFEAWCRDARAQGVGDGGVGLLVYTVTHMVRGRLISRQLDPDVDDLIETTRGNLARLLGHALAELPLLTTSQAGYAEPAAEIARLVAELAEDADQAGAAAQVRERLRLLVPPTWDSDDGDAGGGPDVMGRPGTAGHGGLADLASLGGYHVFDTSNDRVVAGRDLYPEAVLTRHRTELDAQVHAQAVSVPRLALRLRRLFASDQTQRWSSAEELGVLDRQRLAGLVARPDDRNIFRLARSERHADTAVTLLVDTSGSMKTQRLGAVSVLVDTYARALDLAGITCEILGFTTRGWSGGRAAVAWRAHGEPADPGRLTELEHIVYKSADETWRSARLSLAAMAKSSHYREGVDGEALAWAFTRLQRRPERRRVLVVISDGAPMETATTATNRPGFLHDHLAAVADHIERFTPVELGAIGMHLDLDRFYRNHTHVDLAGTLTLTQYRALETLAAAG